MRILLVEDDADGREAYRTMLEKLGHSVIEAIDGQKAIEAALHEQPDLVLMDINIPDVDGLLATSALRTITNFTQLPIIAMTAYPTALVFDKVKRAGCDAFLPKPFTVDLLRATLSQVAHPRRSQTA